jgi:hypothetical protein
MNVEFEFTKEDLIEFELYLLNNISSLKKRTQNSKILSILVIPLCLIASIGGFLINNTFLGGLFGTLTLVFIYLYWANYRTQNVKKRLMKLEDEDVKVPNAYFCRR